MRDMVNSACGNRPSVIVMSACYSGQFVAPLQGDNRIIMTAARPDRTSFGCGELDHYTFFDDCFLRALPMAGDFPGLGRLVQQCVAAARTADEGDAAVRAAGQCGAGGDVHLALAG